jgi:hypothetical protein
MTIYYRIPISLVCIFISLTIFSQEVIATQGGRDVNSDGSLDYTIGEAIITFGDDGSNVLTQGFQQPVFEVMEVLDIQSGFAVNIFPNPATEYVNIQFQELKEGYLLMLVDELGKMLVKQEIKTKDILIPFNKYSTGVYFLSIIDDKQTKIKTYKIQKSH